MSLRSLVVDVGARLGRSASDVEPFLHSLQDNWYDSIDSVLDASADDLASIGLPRRFAVELAAAAPGFRKGGGGKSKGKGKSKDKGKDDDRKGKGKGKSKGRSGELRHTLPIDVHGIANDFAFRPKIIGNRGSNVHHIQDQCGVTVELQGHQEDGELRLVITANDDASLDKAIQMCEDLINTVFAEYDEYSGGGGDSGHTRKGGKGKKGDRKGDGKGKKGKGKGKAKKGARELGEDEIEERVHVSTEGIDPDFYLRAKLVGEGGVNVKHIEGESGCHVAVSHDDGDGMAFVIQGKDEATVNSAKEMCEDLLANVLESVGATPKRSKGEGKGKKGKGKGKGKRREREFTDTDDQPSKRSRDE